MTESDTSSIIDIAYIALKDFGKGQKFVAKIARIARQLGSTGLGCMLTVVPAKRGRRQQRTRLPHA
jgi:hypothetical protein